MSNNETLCSITIDYTTIKDMTERYLKKLKSYYTPSSYRVTCSFFSCHLVRPYGDMYINDFSVGEASSVVNKMFEDGRSLYTIRTCCNRFRAAFESERCNGRLLDNPWDHVRLPQRELPQKRFLSDVELLALEDAFSKNPLGNYFGFILHTGLRRAEVTDVEMGDWDGPRHVLKIRGTETQPGNTQALRAAGNAIARDIPLSDIAETYLNRAIRRRLSCLGANIRGVDNNAEFLEQEPVFAEDDGRPLTSLAFRRYTEMVRRESGIEDFCEKLLRNHFVITQLESGTSPYILQTYLGFASRSTLRGYMRPRPNQTSDAAYALESFFDRLQSEPSDSLRVATLQDVTNEGEGVAHE